MVRLGVQVSGSIDDALRVLVTDIEYVPFIVTVTGVTLPASSTKVLKEGKLQVTWDILNRNYIDKNTDTSLITKTKQQLIAAQLGTVTAVSRAKDLLAIRFQRQLRISSMTIPPSVKNNRLVLSTTNLVLSGMRGIQGLLQKRAEERKEREERRRQEQALDAMLRDYDAIELAGDSTTQNHNQTNQQLQDQNNLNHKEIEPRVLQQRMDAVQMTLTLLVRPPPLYELKVPDPPKKGMAAVIDIINKNQIKLKLLKGESENLKPSVTRNIKYNENGNEILIFDTNERKTFETQLISEVSSSCFVPVDLISIDEVSCILIELSSILNYYLSIRLLISFSLINLLIQICSLPQGDIELQEKWRTKLQYLESFHHMKKV